MKPAFPVSSETRHAKAVFASKILRSLLLGAAVAGGMFTTHWAQADDSFSRGGGNRTESIFVGDIGDPNDTNDDTIKQVDLRTGAVRVFASSTFGAELNGVMGIIFNDASLIASIQNFSIDPTASGDVIKLNGRTGMFEQYLVNPKSRNVPYAPQGIVFGGGTRDWHYGYQPDHYYVANVIKSGQTCTKVDEGDVREYSESGAFVRTLDRGGFAAGFYPRGVVFGPGGMLYVAARGCPAVAPTDPLSLLAYILRFNPYTHKLDKVIATNASVQSQGLKFGFHRPEGLVFDDKGYLWVTSFRDTTSSADPLDKNNVDRILKFDVRSGKVVDSLPLSDFDKPRASAQALIFGPEGKLYIPISGSAAETTGELRRCDTRTKKCDVVVPVGGGLVDPWFAVFRNSDPATLSYERR
ncbi:hypothetical protein [Caballeronia sp. HLA56]